MTQVLITSGSYTCYLQGQSDMAPECPCVILLVCQEYKALTTHHSSHFSGLYLQQATLSDELTSSPQLKSRLASPSYKSSEFLKLIVPLLLHDPLNVLDLCHPCRTWGTWETNANGHEALTTTFAVNNKVFATDPEVSCFIWHP